MADVEVVGVDNIGNPLDVGGGSGVNTVKAAAGATDSPRHYASQNRLVILHAD